MQTTEIICTTCGAPFSFSQEEREFYESKGFQQPRKCKPCRDAAKQQREGGGGYGGGNRGGYGGGYDRPQRQMYDTVCAECGVNTQVPFAPNGSKPVYCRNCFQSRSAY
jgi:CxxC-x17-CxxC domain-containing protein